MRCAFCGGMIKNYENAPFLVVLDSMGWKVPPSPPGITGVLLFHNVGEKAKWMERCRAQMEKLAEAKEAKEGEKKP